jgi:biotin carboxyl carrier protein
MINEFKYKDDLYEAKAEISGSMTEVMVGDNKYAISPLGIGKYIVELNGARKKVCCVVKGSKSYVDIDGVLLELSIPGEENGAAGGPAGVTGEKDKIYAPMPGKIVKILVEEGQEIAEKQPMVIVEAMKMENQVNALAAGTVMKINFKAGDQVDTETPIIELEIPEE